MMGEVTHLHDRCAFCSGRERLHTHVTGRVQFINVRALYQVKWLVCDSCADALSLAPSMLEHEAPPIAPMGFSAGQPPPCRECGAPSVLLDMRGFVCGKHIK